MLTSKMVRFSAVALVGFVCMLATEARAQIVTAQTAPLTCNAPLAFGNGKFVTVEAVPGGTPPTFPHDVTGGSCPLGQTCSEYNYKFTSSNGSNLTKSYLSVSSDLDIYEVSPAAFIENPVCEGDNLIGRFVCEQRQIRFNSQPSGFNAKLVVSRAAPRVSTGGAIVGLLQIGFCLIQGPGVPGGAFTAIPLAQVETVAGGLCEADWITHPGQPYDVSSPTPGCFTGKGTITAASVGGQTNEQMQDSGGATVTVGSHTSSCKLVNGIATCVCRAQPCP